ncbi:MAG: hypothetical protein ACYDCC_15275 [Actinomycetota bacterium]
MGTRVDEWRDRSHDSSNPSSSTQAPRSPKVSLMVLAISSFQIQTIVAATTGLLALGTGWLAFQTQRLASKTSDVVDVTKREAAAVERQAELTKAALQATTRPWLLAEEDGRVGVWLDENGFVAAMTVRNVGSGVAVVPGGDQCRIIQSDKCMNGPHTRFGWADVPLLSRGDIAHIRFDVDAIPLSQFAGQDQSIDGEFFIEIDYTDAGGIDKITMRLHVCLDKTTMIWFVRDAEYRESGLTTALLRVERAPYPKLPSPPSFVTRE